jgi:hypothetical protein
VGIDPPRQRGKSVAAIAWIGQGIVTRIRRLQAKHGSISLRQTANIYDMKHVVLTHCRQRLILNAEFFGSGSGAAGVRRRHCR